ncbi:MAG: helix-turn-helix domain-containing protein [Anaeromyxobacteraceae bacterium]
MKLGSTQRLRDRMKEEAQRAILEAAEHVFGEEGFSARLDRVAARAGVAVGTLYNHFEDREALVGALSRARREALLARLDAALEAGQGKPFEAQLRSLLAAFGEHVRTHGRFLSRLAQAGEGPARAVPRGTLLDALRARADVLVARGVEVGALREDGRERFGLALVGLARTLLIQALVSGEDFAATEAAVAELFLRGAGR